MASGTGVRRRAESLDDALADGGAASGGRRRDDDPRHGLAVLVLVRRDEYGPEIMRAARSADVLIGSDDEFRAAGSTPAEALALGPRLVFVKHGPNGATLLSSDRDAIDVPGFPVEVVNGLGAGDAFARRQCVGDPPRLRPLSVLRLANVAGALVAERIPCSAGMPTASRADGPGR